MENDLVNLSISSEFDENKNLASNSPRLSSSVKVNYYDRKLEGKLRKYEAYLKKHENINRVENESQVSIESSLIPTSSTLKRLIIQKKLVFIRRKRWS